MLQDDIDPISYADRLTMPILVITATGDEFFAPDDSYEYFDMLVVSLFIGDLISLIFS